MSGPHLGLTGRTPTPRGQQYAVMFHPLGLHKHLGESGVCRIGTVGSKHEFRIRGQRDPAFARTLVGECDASPFDIPIRYDRHIQPAEQRIVLARHTGVVVAQLGGVGISANAIWLGSGRPRVGSLFIPQQHIASPAVADGILTPTCNGKPAPLAVAAARNVQHHRVTPIGEQLHVRWSVNHGRGRG